MARPPDVSAVAGALCVRGVSARSHTDGRIDRCPSWLKGALERRREGSDPALHWIGLDREPSRFASPIPARVAASDPQFFISEVTGGLAPTARNRLTACSLAGMLPAWPAGTVTILSTSGEEPHAIPVSAVVRSGPRRVLIALAAGRESLARLLADPRVALTILADGDIAMTAHGAARVLDDPLVDGVVAVEIQVERLQNHGRDAFVIEAGVRWRWIDPAAQARDAAVRKALTRLTRS